MGLLPHILRTLRPHQWVKNLFVLAPLVFAKQADDVTLWIHAAIAFGLFSSLSGCVYLLNDIVDVESDRAHPTKCNRPIAAGQLPLGAAKLTLALLLCATTLGALTLSPTFAAVGLTYFTLNVGYSFALKHIPFVDVIVIALGFILRIFGGAVAIDVPISMWLGCCTFLLAMYLGLGKRKHELLLVKDGDTTQRRVLARYDLGRVRLTMHVLGAMTAATYATYTVIGETAAMFSPQQLTWTIPFVLIGLIRFNTLTGRIEQGQSPTDLMLRDVPFLANIVAWTAAVIALIYSS